MADRDYYFYICPECGHITEESYRDMSFDSSWRTPDLPEYNARNEKPVYTNPCEDCGADGNNKHRGKRMSKSHKHRDVVTAEHIRIISRSQKELLEIAVSYVEIAIKFVDFTREKGMRSLINSNGHSFEYFSDGQQLEFFDFILEKNPHLLRYFRPWDKELVDKTKLQTGVDYSERIQKNNC
jgi:hypothetical protein